MKKIATGGLLVLAISAVLSLLPAVAAHAPVASYALNEGSGPKTADASGTGNTGMLRNGAAWTTGKNGNAVSFDGLNDHVYAGSAAVLDNLPALTASAWVYPITNGNNGWGVVFSKEYNTAPPYIEGWHLGFDGWGANRLQFVADFSGGALQVVAATQLSMNQWQHVAVTWDGSANAANVHIYINGTEVPYLSRTNGSGSRVSDDVHPLVIGSDSYAGSTWNGKIDDVRIYASVLSVADIQGDMNTPVGGTPPPPDTTPPVVSMTAPTDGALVSGTSTAVSASASDNTGVAGVQFKLDGANLGAEDTVSPYTILWDTTKTTNGTHTLSAVARDAAGNTATATAVSATVDNPTPDTTPPTISSVAASAVIMTAATISWTTSEPSDSQVEYGPTTAYGNATALDTALVTSHSQGLSGLAPGTTYHYRVKSKDASGNLSVSADAVFATAADTVAPATPMGLSANAVSASEINLSWAPSTDNVGVEGYKIMRDGNHIATTSAASYSDTGLLASTTYIYRVSAFDTSGNISAASDPASGTTKPPSAHPFDTLNSRHWYEVPNSHLFSVLPNPFPPNWGGPESIVTAWSGGAYDTTRDRYVIWGGGHADWGGNEIYTFDIGTLAWARPWGPTPNASIPPIGSVTNETYADGNPVSRHTYEGLEYITSIDKFFSQGGSRYSDGSGTSATWMFDFATLSWQRKADFTSIHYADPGFSLFTAYDPITKHVFEQGNVTFAEYDPVANTWTERGLISGGIWSSDLTAAIDPVRRLFVAVGGGRVIVWDLNTWTKSEPPTSGDQAIVNAVAPGLEYNPQTGTFIGWNGSATVYELNPSTWTWTVKAPAATNTVIPTSPTVNGTYGRFRYIPSKNVFIVVNSINQNVYVYKP